MGALVAVFAVGCLGDEEELDLERQQQELGFLQPDIIVEISVGVKNIAQETDGFFSLRGHRTMAMMNIAAHDALNSLIPIYETYAFRTRTFGHPIAAVAQAMRDVAVAEYPDRAADIDALYQPWVDSVRDGLFKTRGLELGADSAAAIIANRADDNSDAFEPFPSSDVPGEYQYTAPFDFAFGYGWRLARPFAMTASDQFRQPPPPALDSAAYADALNEVQSLGAAGSTTRTEDQTNIAYWWLDFVEGSFPEILGGMVADENFGLWRTARLYALFGMDNFDGYVGVFDGKYHHAFWRPVTAVTRADEDGNDDTTADPAWASEVLTPPFPTYPSAHTQACFGAAQVITRVFGTSEVGFTRTSPTGLPGAEVRTYDDVKDAATDCGLSRIYNGFHYRFDVDSGKAMGEDRANYIVDNFLQPRWW